MLRRLLLAAGLSLGLALPATADAQVPVLDVRLGAQFIVPTGDLANDYESGYGVYGRIGAPLGITKLMGSVTWNRLKVKDDAFEDIDVITVQAGPHFSMTPLLDFGFEAAWFSKVEEFGISPSVSLSLLKFDLTASYNTTFASPQASWIGIGGGFRF